MFKLQARRVRACVSKYVDPKFHLAKFSSHNPTSSSIHTLSLSLGIVWIPSHHTHNTTSDNIREIRRQSQLLYAPLFAFDSISVLPSLPTLTTYIREDCASALLTVRKRSYITYVNSKELEEWASTASQPFSKRIGLSRKPFSLILDQRSRDRKRRSLWMPGGELSLLELALFRGADKLMPQANISALPRFPSVDIRRRISSFL